LQMTKTTNMNIALIGATGFVGSAILKEAMTRNMKVTAIVRNTGKLASGDQSLHVVKGDVMNTEELAGLLKGHDVVISAYNPGWTNPEIYSEFIKGTQSIQEATKRAGVQRLMVIGGAGSLFVAPGVQLVDTKEFPGEWKPGALAARDYYSIIQKEQDLEWTFVSPAIEMHPGTSGIRKGTYRTGTDSPVFDETKRSVISVEDLAVAVIDEAEKGLFKRRRFTVAY
jgi:uncharacterized protein